MESTIKSMSKEEVLKIALTCGKLLLTSGAETYRVEDTMARICAQGGITDIAAISTPSWIMIGDESTDAASMVSRVTRRGTDLTLISEVNNMSYHMPEWEYSFSETMAMLHEMSNRPPQSALYSMVWSGFAGGFFAGVIGGGPYEFLAGFLGSFLSMAFICLVRPFHPSSFWETTMAGVIICIVTYLFRLLVPQTVMELAIGGAIMPYLPGMAFTNGIRDFMAGDLISGTSRAGEAIFLVGGIAIGIAAFLGILYM
jgi:uncharacterized membrane protein YjjP (DUF1212 family)